METLNGPVWQQPPADANPEAVPVVPVKTSHLMVRVLIFVVACAAGWGLAFGVNMLFQWLHHRPALGEPTQFTSWLQHSIDFLTRSFTR